MDWWDYIKLYSYVGYGAFILSYFILHFKQKGTRSINFDHITQAIIMGIFWPISIPVILVSFVLGDPVIVKDDIQEDEPPRRSRRYRPEYEY